MLLSLPDHMTAVEIQEFGGPEVLKPTEMAIPTVRPGEVLIKVAAAGVNRPDVLQRKGGYPAPPGASEIPGLEVAGIIAATGVDVHGWHIGEEVCALVAGGGYAEYCAVPAEQVLPAPSGLSMAEAAALPETFFTVWTNVFERAGLIGGERLLVHGGSSGIGTAAIMMAREWGAEVYTTAGTDKKCAFCEELGARVAINYKTEDFVARVKEATNDEGVDVILDMVGGDYVNRNIEILRMGGRHVSIALLGGVKAEVNLAPILFKHLTLTGSTLRGRAPSEKGRIAGKVRRHFWPLLEAGRIRPVIDSTLPLAQAADAHRRMEASQHIGKIVLVV